MFLGGYARRHLLTVCVPTHRPDSLAHHSWSKPIARVYVRLPEVEIEPSACGADSRIPVQPALVFERFNPFRVILTSSGRSAGGGTDLSRTGGALPSEPSRQAVPGLETSAATQLGAGRGSARDQLAMETRLSRGGRVSRQDGDLCGRPAWQ